jgi:thiol-disulfide isomerase/thioredoxin
MPGSAIRVQIETIPVENPMKKRIVAIVLCCASAALLTSMPLMADDAATAEGAMTAAAEPMDMNAKFEQASEEFWDWARMLKPGEYSGEKHREIAMKCFGDIDFSQLSMENIRQAPQMIGPAEDLSARMQTVLMERAGDASVDGVRAAMLSMQMAEDEDTTKDMLELVLTHPSLDDAIKDGMASELFGTLAYLDPAWLAPMADKLASLGDVMFDAIEPLDARSASSYFEAMLSLRDTIGKERLESIRLRTLGFMNNAIDVAKEENPDMVDWLTGMTEFLDGAFAKGMLLDHPAPAIAFTWANGRHGEITSLDDLKGKVVVLDFWATWCGPCVGSFPNVRELQAFYDGYDVAIIGVTSIQGSHIDPDNGPVDCEGDPDKEMSLMPDFMQKKDVTWTVAFSKQEVFNPDYGVRGIPHVTIIDPEGIVRYNGLHPASPKAEKVEKINKLLKDAGLAYPEFEAEEADEQPAA